MTVRELIRFLKKHPPDMEITYRACSENCELEVGEITVEELCEARPDGWVANARPDKPTKRYLRFPGN